MEVVSTLPQELVKEFLADKILDSKILKETSQALVKTVTSDIPKTIAKNIPKDSEGCYYQKQFFLGNLYFNIRLH